MAKKHVIIGLCIVALFILLILFNTKSETGVEVAPQQNLDLLGGRTIEQVEAQIAERSAQWRAEQPYAERGRIAQETMKVLNRQNLLDKELLNLVRPLTSTPQANAQN